MAWDGGAEPDFARYLNGVVEKIHPVTNVAFRSASK
jgi:hypothetical protein